LSASWKLYDDAQKCLRKNLNLFHTRILYVRSRKLKLDAYRFGFFRESRPGAFRLNLFSPPSRGCSSNSKPYTRPHRDGISSLMCLLSKSLSDLQGSLEPTVMEITNRFQSMIFEQL